MDEPTEHYIIKSHKTPISRYFIMGKLAVLKSKLYEGRLRVVYSKNLNTYPKFKSQAVTNKFIECLMDIITNKDNFDMYLFMNLDFKESGLMLLLLADSGYGRQIGFDEVKAYKNRMKVLQGELASGNDNKELVTESLNVIKKLRQMNAISVTEAKDIITDLEQY